MRNYSEFIKNWLGIWPPKSIICVHLSIFWNTSRKCRFSYKKSSRVYRHKKRTIVKPINKKLNTLVSCYIKIRDSQCVALIKSKFSRKINSNWAKKSTVQWNFSNGSLSDYSLNHTRLGVLYIFCICDNRATQKISTTEVNFYFIYFQIKKRFFLNVNILKTLIYITKANLTFWDGSVGWWWWEGEMCHSTFDDPVLWHQCRAWRQILILIWYKFKH